MNKPIFIIILLILVGCTKNPLTGRRELSLVPNAEVLSMSSGEYSSFISGHKVSTDAQKTALVNKVGNRIARAVENYLRQVNLSNEISEYKWEFHLVEDPQVNAWCMPGGKVVVYTGILPITQDENGLAVVLGHEISHAVSKHGNERMSQQLLEQLGGAALSIALINQSQQAKNLYMAAYGTGAEVGVLLPFSREEEYEADHLGLVFMSMAGYDPQTAINFWQRMAARNTGGSGSPAFLSDHPVDDKRIKRLQKEMPEAMKYYKPQ